MKSKYGIRWVSSSAMILASVLFFASVGTLTAQSITTAAPKLPKIVMSPLDTPPGDPIADGIAAAVSQSLALMLHLTGSFTLENADFLDPVLSYQRSILYYQQVAASIGIFGSVSSSKSGAYTVTVEYWRAAATAAPPKKFTSTFTNVFAVFSAADRLALDVASAAAGRKLSVGTVALENATKLHNYAIYADGQLVARNRSRVQVLSGRRTIIVAVAGPVGDVPVQTFHTDVKADETVKLILSPTAASGKPAEGSAKNANGTALPHAKVGTLLVATSPEGATVLLDGKPVGTTPLGLSSLSEGTHTLNFAHQYFLAAHRVVTIKTGHTSAIDVKLTLNKRDPAIVKRMTHPLGASASSQLWSAAQVGNFVTMFAVAGTTNSAGQRISTTSFWGVQPYPLGVGLGQMLSWDSNIFLSRIGNRLADNSLRTTINDVVSGTGAALITIDLAPSWTNPSAAQSGTYKPLTNSVFTGIGAVLLGADLVYDAVTAPSASRSTNSQLLQYVSEHGTLPPQRITGHPHRIIIATGGDSFVRGGYDLPIVRNYLSLEATGGVGASSFSPFSLAVSGNTDISYNPWGMKTGNLRPEIFVGLRASTDFSSASVAPEIGTGNDWIGRNFDIFTRGGFDYNLIGHHWDQFFTMGTRIF